MDSLLAGRSAAGAEHDASETVGPAADSITAAALEFLRDRKLLTDDADLLQVSVSSVNRWKLAFAARRFVGFGPETLS